MSHLRLPHWLLTLLTVFIIVACNNNPSQTPTATNCRNVTHKLGTTEVCGTPERIVVLGSHSLDLLLSLGEQPAGFGSVIPFAEGEVFDQPEAQIPYLGQFVTTEPVNVGSADQPSLETLAKLQPDLIVGEAGRNEVNYDLLSQIAPTLLWDTRTQQGQWQKNIRALALALGDEEKGEDAIAHYNQLVATAREEFLPVTTTTPKVLLLGANSLASGQISAITPKSYLGELMAGVGFEVVAPPTSLNYAPLSLEVLPDLDEADHIFVLGYEFVNREGTEVVDPDNLLKAQTVGIKKDWQENAIAQSLQASQADQVYFSTYLLWNGLNGPLGTELILEELRQFLLTEQDIS
jgi:iron complex transport system substrate-binding protein